MSDLIEIHRRTGHRRYQIEGVIVGESRCPAVEVEEHDDRQPFPRRSVINLDSVENVSVAVLVQRLGRLSDERMRQVCAALEVAVDCSA